MPHQTRHVGSFAERRIPDHVKIRETREAQRFADPMPAGFLNVEEKFRCAARLHTGEERQHARRRILRLRAKGCSAPGTENGTPGATA